MIYDTRDENGRLQSAEKFLIFDSGCSGSGMVGFLQGCLYPYACVYQKFWFTLSTLFDFPFVSSLFSSA